MKILHYALGFPPYRSGGLTKLCVDLMVQQAKEGHTVAMLWPGQMGFVNQKVTIKNHENVKLSGEDILSLEVINPLPVSFDEGIADIAAFTKNVEAEAYKRLLDSDACDGGSPRPRHLPEVCVSGCGSYQEQGLRCLTHILPI